MSQFKIGKMVYEVDETDKASVQKTIVEVDEAIKAYDRWCKNLKISRCFAITDGKMKSSKDDNYERYSLIAGELRAFMLILQDINSRLK